MARTTVVHDSRSYTVNFLDPQARGRIYQALVIGQFLDETTGEPVSTSVHVATTLTKVRVKSATDGVAGVVGVPVKVFPNLRTTPYNFEVTFTALGFIPFTARVSFVPQPNFPDEFTARDLGQIGLRREPVSVVGAAVQLDPMNRFVPVANADIEVSGMWRTVQGIDLSVPAPAANLLAIVPSLYADRPLPGADVEIVTLTPVAEPDRWLEKPASPGDREIRVNQSIGIVPGSLIGIDRTDPDRAEHIEVLQVVGPSDPNSPATLRLRFPLKHRHRETTPTPRVNAPAAGPPDATLTDGGRAGDNTIFVNSTAAFGPTQTVRIQGGPSVPEYAECRLYRAVSDADGLYRLPRLSRLAAVEITASRAAPLPALNAVEPVSLNYALFDNRHDLTLS